MIGTLLFAREPAYGFKVGAAKILVELTKGLTNLLPATAPPVKPPAKRFRFASGLPAWMRPVGSTPLSGPLPT
jgi:hypothetical protein